MSRRNYIFFVIAVIISAVILNVTAVYFLYCRGEYVQTSDIIGNEYLEKRTVLQYADRLLTEYDYADYHIQTEKITDEITKLEEYRAALKYSSEELDSGVLSDAWRYADKPLSEWAEEILAEYDLTDEQAAARIEQLEYCVKRLKYAASYSDYIKYISDNSSKLLSMPILNENSFASQNASKAKRDFYGLENIKPTAENDIGVICLFSDRITDIFMLAVSLITAALYVQYRKRQTVSRKAGIFVSCLTICAGATLIYLCGGILIQKSIGLGDLSRPVQSVRTFLTCSSVMTVSALTAMRIIFKIVICAAVYFISAGFFISPKIRSAIVIFFIILGEIILYSMGGIFSSASILSGFSSEKIFGIYENVNIFGNAITPQAIFIPAIAITIFFSAVFAVKRFSAFELAARETAEKAYYTEVSRTYDEARKIRHDISNHLSALAVLLDGGKPEEARKYLSEISDQLYTHKLPVSTGRTVLDALIYSKMSAAEKHGITMDISFSAPIGEKYSDFDLCGIFGNILDNAIEGCQKVNGEKKISLTVKRQMDMLCIFCENPCVSMKASDTLNTDKPDKSAHGFGLKRIRQIAEKYGGGVETSVQDGKFTISIII